MSFVCCWWLSKYHGHGIEGKHRRSSLSMKASDTLLEAAGLLFTFVSGWRQISEEFLCGHASSLYFIYMAYSLYAPYHYCYCYYYHLSHLILIPFWLFLSGYVHSEGVEGQRGRAGSSWANAGGREAGTQGIIIHFRAGIHERPGQYESRHCYKNIYLKDNDTTSL